MAQLTDDCFAFGGKLLPLEEAVAQIAERFPVIAGSETVPLAQADGRIAAEDVFAKHALPPFTNSAVDGYAVRHADLTAGRDRAAGDRPPARGRPGGRGMAGGAIRIFTGAPMPPGADTVFMQEDVRREGERVALPPGLKLGANARPAGRICLSMRWRSPPVSGYARRISHSLPPPVMRPSR
ncbi:hypothetical protein ACFQWF_18160 [Methylorubrum suomiense]